MSDLDSLERLLIDAARRPDGMIGLLGVSRLAEVIGKRPSWIYEHASSLGAIRLGTGSKAPLAFDPRAVARRLVPPEDRTEPSPPAPSPGTAPPRPRARRRRAVTAQSGLLDARDRWAEAQREGG